MIIKYYKKVCKSGCDGMNKQTIETVVNELGIKADVKLYKGEDAAASAGIPELPALLIDDKLVLHGYKPTLKEIKKLIQKASK